MNELTRLLSHWLAKNNVERDGVKIIIEFPSQEAAYRAEMAIKREIEPYQAYIATNGTFGAVETMNGIGLSLRVAAQRS